MEFACKELTRAGIAYAKEEPLCAHTSFRIGGPVEVLVFPKSEEELIFAVKCLENLGKAPLILGNGSNILAADGPISRVIIKTHDGVGNLRQVDETAIYVSSGALLSKAATFAKEIGLTGLEFAHGIPGTMGGAVVMNAGAYGGEMAQVIRSVDFLEKAGLSRKSLKTPDLDFSYRHSRFSNTDDVILGAVLTLNPGNAAEIQAKMDELSQKRRNSQPLNFPSGGSTFKRPQGGYAAALIDEAGLKGHTIGGAQVSEKHAGFVVNRGDATCADVLRLIEHIQETVLRQTGIALEPEIELIT